jgi:hypothetical protein
VADQGHAIWAAQCLRAELLARDVDSLKREEFLSPGPRSVAEQLVAVTDRVETALRALPGEKGADGLTPAEFVPMVARFGLALAVLFRQVGRLRDAGKAGALAAWERPLAELLPPSWNASLIAYPTHELMNYETLDLTDAFATIATRIGITDLHFKTRFYLMSFPIVSHDAALQNALLFHELGHVCLFVSHEQSSFTEDELNSECSSDRYAGESDDEFWIRLNNWVREIACDTIALHVGGMAYLAALCELFLTRSIDAGSSTHPPTLWRTHAASSVLQDSEASNALTTLISDWLALLPLSDSSRACDFVITKGRELAKTVLASVSSLKRWSWENVNLLEVRLSLEIPPNEVPLDNDSTGPVTLAQSLTAGWASYAARLAAAAPHEVISVRRKLDVLTAKGIELAEATRMWRSAEATQ